MKKTGLKRIFTIAGTGIALIAVLIFLAFKFTPWPSALLIRYAFTKGAKAANEALLKYVPKGVTVVSDQQYAANDKDAFLDVYYPIAIAQKDTVLPVVVWIHGGGWVSGTKKEASNYYRILADKGFVVVSIDYSIAPEKNHPLPLKQVNAALAFLTQNAKRFHIDAAHFFIAGDSGGAHIAAQVANIISDQSYSRLTGIVPGISRNALTGLLLYCGPYDVSLADLNGKFGGFLKTILWAYSGKKDFKDDPLFKTASVIDYIDGNFPPSFISVGNGDPLQIHSLNLARKLSRLKVKVDTLFFPANRQPPLPHEFQFDLDVPAGKLALQRSVEFIKDLTDQ